MSATSTNRLIENNKNRKGKTLDQIYGKNRADLIRSKMRKNHKGMLGLRHKIETIEMFKNCPSKKTKEFAEKMRISKLGEKNPMFGKHLSYNHREKLRIAQLKIKNRPPILYGENHPQWRGGREKYYGPNWTKQKNLARKRDNYICSNCKTKEDGRAHDVHHIVPFRKFGKINYLEANNLNNLITLCPSCHCSIEARRKKSKE